MSVFAQITQRTLSSVAGTLYRLLRPFCRVSSSPKFLFESFNGNGFRGNSYYLLLAAAQNPKTADAPKIVAVKPPYLRATRQFLASKNIRALHVVSTTSLSYLRALLTASHLTTDTHFPPFYAKRPGQSYFNTWHGTPLKAMGFALPAPPRTLPNIIRNFLSADILLHPNPFTCEKMRALHGLDGFFRGAHIVAGYPRNAAFFDKPAQAALRHALGLDGKNVVAFMTTWRDTQLLSDRQNAVEAALFDTLRARLPDDTVVFAHAHAMNRTARPSPSVRPFPDDVEPYEFLSIADVLVTDYSSVLFDFACTGRKIVLFPHDLAEYRAVRGDFLLPFDSLPFPKALDADALLREITAPTDYPPYPAFQKDFTPFDNADVHRRILDRWLGLAPLDPVPVPPAPPRPRSLPLPSIATRPFSLRFRTRRGRDLRAIVPFALSAPFPVRLEGARVLVDGRPVPARIRLASKTRLSAAHSGLLDFSVPATFYRECPASSPVVLAVPATGDGGDFHFALPYSSLPVSLGRHSPLAYDPDAALVATFRQYRDNSLRLYVRARNGSDSLASAAKQALAAACAALWHTPRARRLVLLFEKNAARYEESAAAAFEALLDHGCSSAYFVTTPDRLPDVPDQYRSHILLKNSFRHYLHFFRAPTFIGTETLVHAFDLKTFSRLALAKLRFGVRNYVFLQHGPSYCISFDAEQRTFYRPPRLGGKYRVVVNSQAEADHFVQLGRHRPEWLYITGFPKFDRASRDPGADLILLMPTWRPWEVNSVRSDFRSTSYFRFARRLLDAVPPDLRPKARLLPHPLVARELRAADPDAAPFLPSDTYDRLLRRCRLLVTDYSSISFDAFYRGAHVLFDWTEKDATVARYGPHAKLMLTPQNVFAPVVSDPAALPAAIAAAYATPPTPEAIERFRHIVAFHDGRNTERLVEALRADRLV